jgi:excisionase family DNA binding protein
MLNQERLLTLDEAAVTLNVSKKTLRRWDESGKLIPVRTPGGHRKYREEDIKAFIEDGDQKNAHIKEKFSLNQPDPQKEVERLSILLERSEKENHLMTTQTMGIVGLASRMRLLLERCRQQMLPMDLAKEIDKIMREAKEYD